MAMKDVSDVQVCLAYQYRTSGHNAALPHVILSKISGQCDKVCLRAIERAYKRRLIDCGTGLHTGWLTLKGKELLRESVREEQARRVARTELVNVHCPVLLDNWLTVYKREAQFNIEVNFGGRQAGVDTDRDSLVRLRDNINKLLETE